MLTRADTVIALRNAWADAREHARLYRRPVSAYRFQLMLRGAYDQIRRAKARAAHKATEAAREVEMELERAVRIAARNTYVAPRVIWQGPQHLLDMRTAAELEVLRFEMADAFTATGNRRLFEAQARLAEIEAQLVRKEIAA